MGRLTLSVVALFALVAPWGPTDRDTTVVNVDPQAHVDVVLPSGVGHKTTLSGRVVNAYGVPLRDVSVVAYPLDSQGQVALRRGLATSSDADGTLRISRLPAGRYYLALEPRATDTLRLWFPGTPYLDDARMFDIDGETDMLSGDFVAASASAAIVTGWATTRGGMACSDGVVRLKPLTKGATHRPTKRLASDCRFRFDDLAPGRYLLTARSFGRTEGEQYASVAITLDAGINDYILSLHPPALVSGAINGPIPSSIVGVAVRASPLDGYASGWSEYEVPVESTGTFSMALPPARWKLTLTDLPDNLWFEGTTAGGPVVDVSATDVPNVMLSVRPHAATMRFEVPDAGSDISIVVTGPGVTLHPRAVEGAIHLAVRSKTHAILGSLRPGTYQVNLTRSEAAAVPGEEIGPLTVLLGAGETRTLTFSKKSGS